MFDFIKDAAKSVGGAIKDIGEKAWESVEDAASSAYEDLSSSLDSAWDGLDDALGSAWDDLGSAGGDLWGKVEGAGGDLWGKVEDTGRDLWDKAGTGAEGIWDQVSKGWDEIEGAGGNVWDRVEGAWDQVADGAGDVGGDLWSGVKDAAGGAGDVFGGTLDGIDDYVFDSIDYLSGGTIDVDWDDGDFSVGLGIDDVYTLGASLGDDGFTYESATLGNSMRFWATGDGVGVDGAGGMDYARLPYADLHLEVTDDGDVLADGELQGTLPTPVGMLGGEISGFYQRTDEGWGAGAAFDGDLRTPSGTTISAEGGVSHLRSGDTSVTTADLMVGASYPGGGSLGVGVDYDRIAHGDAVFESTGLSGWAEGYGMSLSAMQRWSSLETPEGSVSNSVNDFDFKGLDAESATQLGGAVAEWMGMDLPAALESDPEQPGLLDRALGYFSDEDDGDGLFANVLGSLKDAGGDGQDGGSSWGAVLGSVLGNGDDQDDGGGLGGIFGNVLGNDDQDNSTSGWGSILGNVLGNNDQDDGGGLGGIFGNVLGNNDQDNSTSGWGSILGNVLGNNDQDNSTSGWGSILGNVLGNNDQDNSTSGWGSILGNVLGNDDQSDDTVWGSPPFMPTFGDLDDVEPLPSHVGSSFPGNDDAGSDPGADDPLGIPAEPSAPGPGSGSGPSIDDDPLGTGSVTQQPDGPGTPLGVPADVPYEAEPVGTGLGVDDPIDAPPPAPEPMAAPEPLAEPSFSEQADAVSEATSDLMDPFDEPA